MSDSSDGETTKGWALVNPDGNLEDSDDGASSSSSCDVALDEDVVHFRHTPRRSSSVVSAGSPPTPSAISRGSPPTPTNLVVPTEEPLTPVTPTNASGKSTIPANFRAHHTDRDPMDFSSQSSDSISIQQQQLPTNQQWPQGARPKTTNLQLPANYTPEQPLQHSSSSSSTITGDTNQSYPSANDDEENVDEDTDDEVEMLAGRVSDEKADSSSMSSIEILNMPASLEWRDREQECDREEKYPVIQPLMTSSAISVEAAMPTEAHVSDRHSSSDTDSDFVRVDQSMVPDNPEDQAANGNTEEHDEGAVASPPIGDQDDEWNEAGHISASNLGNSSLSLDEGRPEEVQVPPFRVVEVVHPHHHPRILPEEEEEEEDDDVAGPSHRFAGEDVLGRHYFARRLNRDMSASVSSSGSDLSSFSFLGLGRHSGRRSIRRQHSEDMSEISSVFTDGSDDLPANMMVGTTKPGPKQYKHKRAERLNTRLNYLVLLVLASVLALGIGHYVGSYQEKYYKHQIREGQVKRLRELQDDLITCLDKRTTETDDKKTFSDMVKSLLGNSVKDDSKQALIDMNDVGNEEEVDEGMDCESCRDGKNRYSETCNTLCVQGGFWAELDEAISELPEESISDIYNDDSEEHEKSISGTYGDDSKESWFGCIDPDGDIPERTSNSVKEGTLNNENLQDTSSESDTQGGFWAEVDEAIWEIPHPSEAKTPDQPADSYLPHIVVDYVRDTITVADAPKSEDHMLDELQVEDEEETQTDDITMEASQQELIVVEMNQEEQTYSYEEAMAMKTKFEKKKDKLEGEETGYIAEEFIVMFEEKEIVLVEKKQDKLEEEEDGYIAEKVIIMPPVVEESEDIASVLEEMMDTHTLDIVDDVISIPPVVDDVITILPVVIKEDKEIISSDDEDDDEVFIEVEDEDGNLHAEIPPKTEQQHHHSETIKQDVEDSVHEEDTVLMDEEDDTVETTLPVLDEQETEVYEEDTSDVVNDSLEDDEMSTRLQDLEEQLQVAKARADMWQKKFVDDHRQMSHPEVVIVKEEHVKSTEKFESTEKIEELQEQLNVANARTNMWQKSYREKKRQTTDEENLKKDSEKSDETKKKSHRDTCGPLGCFTVFENILANFLSSKEGQEFLRFANLTQVLNNATFWEEFVSATNITAYTISDAVYQSYLEFQDYIKSAQASEFVSSFSAVLARAGKSVATAFGAVRNYSTTVGDKAQEAWSSVKNFTSGTIDQHNIHVNNISQLKEKVAAAWDTVRNMSAKVVNNDTKKKFSEVVDQVQDNVKDYVGHFHDNFKDFGKVMKDSWTSVKDTVGKWHDERKGNKKHKGRGKHHNRWNEDDIGRTNEEEDVSSESRSRKQTKSEDHSDDKCSGKKCREKKHKEKQFGPKNKEEKKNKRHKDHRDEETKNADGKCKGKKCQKKEDQEKQFGTKNTEEKKNRHNKETKKSDSKKHHRHENHHHTHHHEHWEDKEHGGEANKQQRSDTRWHENIGNLWNINWEDILNVFNMNCYGVSDCMSHQRSDAAKLYDELTEYKKWLKMQDRKHELKQVRKFLEALSKFLSEADLDDEDLEDLKEDFEEVLEKVGRFVPDQHDRSNENKIEDELEINSTVILDVDMLKKENNDDDSSHSAPERRKFAGFGYQSSGDDDDNWFLRRAKDRQGHDDDDDNWGKDEDREDRDENWFLRRANYRQEHDDDHWLWQQDEEREERDENWFLRRAKYRQEHDDENWLWQQDEEREERNENWFLRRAKDREENYHDKWSIPPHHQEAGGQDTNWYLHWMQGRTDSRTGVTVWDMYRWITDKFDSREDMRQYDEMNWFLKRP